MLPFGFAAVLGLSTAASLAGQTRRPLDAPPEFVIDQWTTEDGLPQNSVNAIVQSPDGYLLVGTFGGLARFDGSRFTLLERGDSADRRVDRVLSLAIGRDGTLWIGTEDGLVRRRNGADRLFTRADGLPDDEIRALHADDTGILWIATGIGGLAWLSEGTFRTIREVEGMPVGHVVSMGRRANRMLRVQTSANRVIEIPGGDPGAIRWQSEPAARRARTPDADLAEESGDGEWVGTINDGLFHFRTVGDSTVVQHYALPDGRLAFRVRSLYRDHDGSVWVGTDANGLLRARRNLFTTYAKEHGLSHDVVTALMEDAAGTIYVATNCGGVNAIDAEGLTVRTYNPRMPGDPDGDPCVFALAEGAGGTVLQGSYGRGVSTLPGLGGVGRSEVVGLPDTVVLALQRARDGTLWVGTRTGGLSAVRDGAVTRTYTTADGLAHNSVRTIVQARDGALWIGTLDGLSRMQSGRFTTYTAADGLSAGHVRAIHEDADGTFWIGTYGGGLNRLRDGVFTAITRSDGLSENVVSSILPDDHGRFWMSGNRGITRVDRSQLVAFAEGRLERIHSVLYGVEDGLLNPETNGGFHPAALKDSRGRFWFPTLEGVAVVDPTREPPARRAPSVTLEEIIVDGVPRPPGEALTLGPDRPNLEFRYAGLSLADPGHVRFRYRLEGFDEGWVEAGARRVAYYPRLPAGSYRFTVRAASRDGTWGEPSPATQLRVMPPFRSLWWVRLGMAATLLLLLGAALRWREAGTRRERVARDGFSRQLIEGQERERKRLAGELHDGLGQDLLIVRNRTLLALRSEDMDEAVRAQLGHIGDVVSGSLESIRELAHNLTPHQLGHLGLSAALETMTGAMAETSGIALEATIETIDGLLPVESEINLYRIVQEALSNIVRHSDARTAALHVRGDGSRVRVTIDDHGRGFSRYGAAGVEASTGGGFGLSGMAERARILGGTLDVRSAPGRGTRIEVSVPVVPVVAGA